MSHERYLVSQLIINMTAFHLHPRVLLNLEKTKVDPCTVRSEVDEREQFILLQTRRNGRYEQYNNGGNILQKRQPHSDWI